VTVAPYGSWSSPISAEMLATAGVGLGQTWLEDGAAYWVESRPAEGGRGDAIGSSHVVCFAVSMPG